MEIQTTQNSGCLRTWKQRVTINGYIISFRVDEHVLKLYCGDGCTAVEIG